MSGLADYEVEALYRLFSTSTLHELRYAFEEDKRQAEEMAQEISATETVEFCERRVEIIDKVLADRLLLDVAERHRRW